MQWKTFIFIIFIIFIFTRHCMYEASVNTDRTYSSMGWTQACEHENGNKRFFSQFLLHVPVRFRILMFNSGEFCDSAADHNRVKVKWQKSVFVSVSGTIWPADIGKLMKEEAEATNIRYENIKTITKVSAKFWIGDILVWQCWWKQSPGHRHTT